ncbi:uncharacterized protein C1orf131 homolog [Pieris napi]|uniref:uncharacterized protein C1orf131 homolog n=1 Tax=Pieris napi TaxID=78633 RepID=UPI001FBA0200|nr:uncharacterized protein C1orf131 homolog [Pieris napi]
MSLVLTKAALALNNAEKNFKVVKFEAHKPKKKESLSDDKKIHDLRSTNSQKKEVDLKKIRHEIVKFGMSGFDSTKKQEAKIALAVSLGAKPPKRAYLNYKELMAKRKQEKLKENEEKQQMKSKSILQTVGQKKKKGSKNDVGHLLSSYGKVQKKDLKKDNKNKGNQKKKNKKLI